MDVLLRIKRLAVARNIRYSAKAIQEMRFDGILESDVVESIANCRRIAKVLQSQSDRGGPRERLYILKGFDYGGTLIYTKGKIAKESQGEVFYVLISAKVSTDIR